MRIKPGKYEEDLVEVLRGFKVTGTRGGAEGFVGCTKDSASFKRTWKKLRDKGFVCFKGNRYCLTDAGRKKLREADK